MLRTDHLTAVFRVGSGDWSWQEEYDRLWADQTNYMDTLATRIQKEGIREPVLLGSDGRIWDGHHRIAVAMTLGLDSVPVEFAGEASKREVERAAAEKAWDEADDTITAHIQRTAGLLTPRTVLLWPRNPYRRETQSAAPTGEPSELP